MFWQCGSLEVEIKDRDSSISSLKSNLASLKAEHKDFAATIGSLEATIQDKDHHIEMLQDQRQRNGQEQQEETDRVQRTSEKLEARIDSLKEELNKDEVSISSAWRTFKKFKGVPM